LKRYAFLTLLVSVCLQSPAPQAASDLVWAPQKGFVTGFSQREPALAGFKGVLYSAWIANDASRAIMITSDASGEFGRGRRINGIDSSADAPALAAFGNRLCLAWRANDPSRGIYASCTSDPDRDWPAGRRLPAVSDVAPAMAWYGRELFVFWRADSHRMHITGSRDGEEWSAGRPINQVDSSREAPAAAVFDGRLTIAFRANDDSNAIFIDSTKNPHDDWPAADLMNRTDSTPRRPALAVLGRTLYLAWTANDPGHALFVASSRDGKRWAPARWWTGRSPASSRPPSRQPRPGRASPGPEPTRCGGSV
jgi:hypothetical protein